MAIMATATSTDVGGAQALLGAELAAMTARGTARRQADRVAGQRAARRAVASLTGWRREDFMVTRAPGGAPVVESTQGTVQVSIAHRDGVGWAAATDRGRPGLDVEAVALRSGAWLRTWFTVAEQALVGDDPVAQTQVWCAKEAVLKALGTGMALHPREVEVVALGGASAQLRLHGDAARCHARLGGGALRVSLGCVDGLVAAGALLSPGDGREAVASNRVA